MADNNAMIAEIIEVASDVCTEWECGFMESIQSRRSLSSKQTAILERIYDKV